MRTTLGKNKSDKVVIETKDMSKNNSRAWILAEKRPTVVSRSPYDSSTFSLCLLHTCVVFQLGRASTLSCGVERKMDSTDPVVHRPSEHDGSGLRLSPFRLDREEVSADG